MPFLHRSRRWPAPWPSLAASLALGLATPVAWAQPAADPAPAPTPAPAPAPAPSAVEGQRVEITGGRQTDTEQRRQSTAAKIVIGREEIDQFGDATLGEVLRRLPGVTVPGAPGRGGAPRMRGLGGGFTQLLIDGQRVPPGFSLDSLPPEQVERIEILRAPTAETGARAIAGTINIITREGYRRRLNDLRLALGVERGELSPSVNWTHNNSAGALTYNLSASVFQRRNEQLDDSETTVTDADTGALLEHRYGSGISLRRGLGSNLNARLQWRLGQGGDMLMLMPALFHIQNDSNAQLGLTQTLRRPETPAYYDTAQRDFGNRFTSARLGLQWRQRLGDWQWQAQGHANSWRSRSDSRTQEFAQPGSTPLRLLQENNRTQDRSATLSLRGSTLAGGEGREHSIVTGAEVESGRRNQHSVARINGVPLLSGEEENLSAEVLRLAGFVQDEWSLNPRWAVHAGLRWEGISTRASAASGEQPRNRSSVWTPLLHAVYKPDPKARDQVRVSLTRSYRSPNIGQLIGTPVIHRDYPASGPNRETSPDGMGNPYLKPELATGLDVAVERYLQNGGVLSANLFYRRINDLIRSTVTLQDVPWSPVQRWVRQPLNIGAATTQGIELEARFRLDQLFTGAPPVELRSNLALYRSRVHDIPGPDNRLDQQAKATANLGADYRLRGTPLTLGGNLNWVPGYLTRVAADQTVTVSRKQVWDAYALWNINPSTALRLSASNLDPLTQDRLTVTDSRLATGTERTAARYSEHSDTSWQLRLELKL